MVLGNIFIRWYAIAGHCVRFVLVAAAIFAIGVTFFWPTTLAFGLSIMGGLGTLSIAAVLPVMGWILDNSVGTEAIQFMSILPGVLIVLYGGLFYLRRSGRTSVTHC